MDVDGASELVDAARAADPGGSYEVMEYTSIAQGKLTVTLDLIFCKCALFEADELAAMLAVLPSHTNSGGGLVIQALHPRVACGDEQ